METSNAKIHLFAFVSASTVFHFELVVSFGVICSLILVKRQFRYLEVDCEKLFHASFFGNVWLPLGEAACYKNALPWRLCCFEIKFSRFQEQVVFGICFVYY